jgi:hypothetical protein
MPGGSVHKQLGLNDSDHWLVVSNIYTYLDDIQYHIVVIKKGAVGEYVYYPHETGLNDNTL